MRTIPWQPEPIWLGQDAYIIGGGPSLANFDWTRLFYRNTIGCNAAYLLGEKVCKICIFGDTKFFDRHAEGLAEFKGTVVTANSSLSNTGLPWLKWMRRKPRGVHTDALGWNTNTGAQAINLAVLLGAKRICLLGFDMKLKEGKANWHNVYGNSHPRQAQSYPRFLSGFQYVVHDLAIKFPDRLVVNLTTDSGLTVFPWQSIEDHFGKEI